MFSKKATKFDKIFTVNLTLSSKCQIDGEDFVNFVAFLENMNFNICMQEDTLVCVSEGLINYLIN